MVPKRLHWVFAVQAVQELPDAADVRVVAKPLVAVTREADNDRDVATMI